MLLAGSFNDLYNTLYLYGTFYIICAVHHIYVIHAGSGDRNSIQITALEIQGLLMWKKITTSFSQIAKF